MHEPLSHTYDIVVNSTFHLFNNFTKTNLTSIDIMKLFQLSSKIVIKRRQYGEYPSPL